VHDCIHGTLVKLLVCVLHRSFIKPQRLNTLHLQFCNMTRKGAGGWSKVSPSQVGFAREGCTARRIPQQPCMPTLIPSSATTSLFSILGKRSARTEAPRTTLNFEARRRRVGQEPE
jgi:hypothetical protein